ncbi:hypothetical protein B0H10DRAFT_1823046, partial [Mycena sp. CBHHK59/15]
FFISTGEGQVEIQENHEQVVKEATRLSRAGYFLKKFIAEAKRQDVDIEQGIQVTDFKLAVEVVEEASGPSKASGFSVEQYQAAREAQGSGLSTSDALDPISDPGIVIWLFEPRRSSKVKHWSGTNEYPPWHQNKLGSTLTAFAHYAYLFSLESTVFCDLQSMSYFVLVHSSLGVCSDQYFLAAAAIDENGDAIQVLFDMMTHTLDQYVIFASVVSILIQFFAAPVGLATMGKQALRASSRNINV